MLHNAGNNLAEAPTFGRGRLDPDGCYDRFAANPEAIGPDDRARYAEAFAAAGVMRAGFELYQAYDQDARDNRGQSRLRVPVLALAGAHCPIAAATEPMMAEVVKHATVKLTPAAGRWIAGENPAAVADALTAFLKG